MAKRRIKIRSRNKDSMNTTTLPHVGRLTAPVYMVLDPVVHATPHAIKNPLSAKQFEWFTKRLMDFGGFKKEDVCIISCAPAVTPETWQLASLVNAHLKESRDELVSLIKNNNPKMIIPFGAKACQQVIGRAVKITKVRGQPIQDENVAGGIPLLPMFSPFFAQRQPENEAAFISDLQTAGRVYKSNYDLDAATLTYKHDYQWCYDLDFLIKKKPKRLSVDVETVGLIAFDPNSTVLTVQLCYEEGKSVCIPINYDRGKLRHHNFIPWKNINREKLLRQVKTLLEDDSIEKVGQNLKFDWLMLWYQLGIEMANYKHDTMLQAHLIDENQRRINIDDLARQHVPEMAGFNDQYNLDPDHVQKTRMDLLPPEKMLPYACGDTDAAWRLCNNLDAILLEDPALYACYEHVTMPAQRAFCYIELNGFPVSVHQLRSFERKLKIHQKIERKYLLRLIPKSIRDKHRDTGVGVKVTRQVIMIDWLYEHPDGLQLEPRIFTKTGKPSTSSKLALPYYVADHPEILRLIDYIKNEKMLNTYTKGFYKYIFDGKIRPTYKLAATVTGRSASADPNGQNFPKRGKMAKEYRKIFQAPEGWCFVALDLSQAELRIAAMMSGDENMLQVYRDGGDIHRATAAGTMGITVDEFLKLPKAEQDLKRFQAKAINFGFLYGMWWIKFREYAKTDYGIDFTAEEAKTIRENFFKTYPYLEHWHNWVQEHVRENGMIRTYDGRIRHLPNVTSNDEGVAKQALRMGINSPVQSIASDLGLMTLGRLIPYLRESGLDEFIKPCGFIHDAIVCLVKDEYAGQACRVVKHYMESNPLDKWFSWTPEIPIIADAEVGKTLSETHELKPEFFEGAHVSYEQLVDMANGKASPPKKKRRILVRQGANHAKNKTTRVHKKSSQRVLKIRRDKKASNQ
jgi:uracil-DNA glycosylase family 4